MAPDGHLGMTALSRVTLAPAGLSCHYEHSCIHCFVYVFIDVTRSDLTNLTEKTTLPRNNDGSGDGIDGMIGVYYDKITGI